MKRVLFAIAVVVPCVVAASQIAAGDGLAPLPNPSATASASAGSSGLAPARIQQGLVSVEVAGRATGVGVVLEGDGRIVTALSAVGPNDLADVRYSDNHIVHTRAGHKDAVLDLALLVPLSGRYTTGLLPSVQDPLVVELRTASFATGHVTVAPAKSKGRVDAHAKDGTGIGGALELEGRAPPSGSPLLDPIGHAMGIATRACRNVDAAACSDMTVIVPIASIRVFLSRTPSNAVPPSPWLGINGAPDTVNGIKGVRVQAVAPHSPAERGGLKTTTDLIVVADTIPIDTPERLAEIVSKHAVGDVLKLSVFAAGAYRNVNITLQAPP